MKLKIIVIFLLIHPLAMADHGETYYNAVDKSINSSVLDLRQDWVKQGDSFNPSVWCYDKAKDMWDREANWKYDSFGGFGPRGESNPYMLSYKPDSPQKDYEYCLQKQQERVERKNKRKMNNDWFKENKPVGRK